MDMEEMCQWGCRFLTINVGAHYMCPIKVCKKQENY